MSEGEERPGRKLIELGVFLYLALIILCGIFVALRYGVLLGLIVFGFGFGPVIGWELVNRLRTWWRPPFPTCHHGSCSWFDYEFVKDTEEGSVYQCGCSIQYMIQPNQRRFVEFRPDGSIRPYMSYRPYGRWERDRLTLDS